MLDWVLMIFLMGGGDRADTYREVQFNTRQACVEALNGVRAGYEKKSLYSSPILFCAYRGVKPDGKVEK